LGGGNHFIEIDEDDQGNKYVVIHSGSRNLGKQVAEYYQGIAVDLNKGKEEYFNTREEIIRTYKEQGRRTEIQKKLKELEKEWNESSPTLPDDLCFLYGRFMEDYIHDVDICQRFAARNREKIAEILLERSSLSPLNSFQTIHNYVDVEEMILRKGAVSARKGEKLLIPINMRDGSLVCLGKGNEDWNFSAPHGAGRLYSRNKAREILSLEEFSKEMNGIYSTCISEQTIDESPMAYKTIDHIVSHIAPTAEILFRIKPIYNFKATE
jgi:RNA-splicing ligase RtcB